MRIAAIEAHPLQPRLIKEGWDASLPIFPSRLPAFLVKVTAEDGTYGLGEANSQPWYLGENSEQIRTCLTLYHNALQGIDPHNLAFCHHTMEQAYAGRLPGGRAARAGVDIALHDLLGKAMGLPVHALLGGAHRTRFELLVNLHSETDEAMASAAIHAIGGGVRALKIKVGDSVLTRGWTRANLLHEVRKIAAVLEAVPADVYIDADANQSWQSPKWAIAMLEQFRGRNNLSIEQPLGFADLTGAAFVRAHASVPVVLDESVWSTEAMIEIIRLAACDRIVAKLNRIGGFFPAARVVAICEAAAIGVSVDTNPFTKLGDTASCHLAALAAVPYPVDCEGHLSYLTFGEDDPFIGGVDIRDGTAILPDAPGLGIDVNWDTLLRQRVRDAAD
jgi:L-alanine-DL-glutamate epimerase-like enolase superfamily enzyme